MKSRASEEGKKGGDFLFPLTHEAQNLRPSMGWPLVKPDGTINMRHPSSASRAGGRMGSYAEIEYGRPSDAWVTRESSPCDWPVMYINRPRRILKMNHWAVAAVKDEPLGGCGG